MYEVLLLYPSLDSYHQSYDVLIPRDMCMMCIMIM